MDPSTVARLSVVACGFIFGLSSGPAALVRIGIALMLLSGLGVVLASTNGHDLLAYRFAIGMVVVVTFLIAMLGALVGAAMRRAFHRRVPGAERRSSVRP